ncbi:S8 family serine peptidase [Streptomyces durmitorensis]|uniref:S8 family serine peptidase n=1 Tax=Streptomyces durmitorensis TaxID=319947 RepID=A0ABY4PYW0_9ACTN|nr:S8 family serine peptidase [Streptomyces durmitorensis]UQT58721.1 S8 family serine peptidase [Streptomyces durmitorensis]
MTRSPAWRRARLLPAVGLAFALLPAGQAATAAPSGVPQATPAARAAHTVTLVTGDKVTVTELGGGKKTVTVDRPAGATGAVRSEIAGDRITVVPDEARPYLSAGTLDKRLFDVTELMRQGLGDEKGGALPLIVTYDKSARRDAGAATPRGADKVRALPSVGGVAVKADGPGAFWRDVTSDSSKSSGARAGSGSGRLADGIGKIWLDGRVEADMAQSNEQIGTPEAWEAGLTGKGVKVAVLDTGVDLSHPGLKDRVDVTKSFIPGEEVADRNGHGTHVTSTVGGSGAESEADKEKGVAPGAALSVGKVLSDEGSGSESQIIAGMEWAAKDVGAKVVSMSLGSQEASDGTDPMAAAVNTLSKDTGALFVIAAGNTGAPSSIGSPGAADSALTIGAVDSADRAAYFTSQGPRIGDQALKPDLSAPGVDILAARSQLVDGEGFYTEMSGTSMATPHVAGVAALLAEKHPDWSGARLKDALMSTSEQLDASAYELGAGRVSVPDAVDAQVTASGSADLGFYSWPYGDNKPVTKTVTYTNSSDAAVELSLAAEGAAEGVATLADKTLTVPAHGTASTTVTGDGAKAPVGNTSGRIVASAAGKPVAHTAFGLVKEEERYTLTVHVKDRDGAATGAGLVFQRLAEQVDPVQAQVGESGTLELRLKPGTYALSSFLDVRGSKGKDSLGLGFLAAPEIVLDQDREVTLDGRTLREVGVDVGKRTETRQLLMEYDRKANGAELMGAVQVPVKYDSIFAAPTAKVSDGSFEYRTVWRLGKPTLDVKGLGQVVAQPGGTVTDGRSKLRIVDAGGGTAADYAGKDVQGKAVVVRRSAASDVTPDQLGQAAQDAGVKALFVTDDVPGRLNAWFGTDDNADRPLQIGTVDAADGARLLAAAKAGKSVETTATSRTPYVYDVSEGHKGAVPRDLTYEPSKRELAVLDTKFHAVKPVAGGEFRYSLTDTFTVGIGFQEKIDYPVERTDYASTGTGQLWHESVSVGPGALEERSGLVSYRGGRHGELDWFKPVWHPWLGTGLGWGQQRYGNTLEFNVPGWGDSGPDHTGFGDVWNDDSMTQFTEVYADGELVDRRQSSGAYVWDASPALTTYKVVTDTTLDPDRWRLATKGHSEWTFESKETAGDRKTFLPLLNLGFDVDTDLAGDVRGGRSVDIGIFSEYVEGAVEKGSIGGGKLEVSYDDGKSWKGVGLDRDGSKAAWDGKLKVPASAEFISLRASASDDRGGAVTQDIVRAVGVR